MVLNRLRALFEEQLSLAIRAPEPERREHAYRLATAVLLVEMTRADHEVHEDETASVAHALRSAFDLDADQTRELIENATGEADRATSLHEFTSLINAHLDEAQKEHVVELLWRVAIADGAIDRYEEHLVRKVADLVYVSHAGYIRAKHRAGAVR